MISDIDQELAVASARAGIRIYQLGMQLAIAMSMASAITGGAMADPLQCLPKAHAPRTQAPAPKRQSWRVTAKGAREAPPRRRPHHGKSPWPPIYIPQRTGMPMPAVAIARATWHQAQAAAAPLAMGLLWCRRAYI